MRLLSFADVKDKSMLDTPPNAFVREMMSPLEASLFRDNRQIFYGCENDAVSGKMNVFMKWIDGPSKKRVSDTFIKLMTDGAFSFSKNDFRKILFIRRFSYEGGEAVIDDFVRQGRGEFSIDDFQVLSELEGINFKNPLPRLPQAHYVDFTNPFMKKGAKGKVLSFINQYSFSDHEASHARHF